MQIAKGIPGLYKVGNGNQRKEIILPSGKVKKAHRCAICGELKASQEDIQKHVKYVHGAHSHLSGTA